MNLCYSGILTTNYLGLFTKENYAANLLRIINRKYCINTRLSAAHQIKFKNYLNTFRQAPTRDVLQFIRFRNRDKIFKNFHRMSSAFAKYISQNASTILQLQLNTFQNNCFQIVNCWLQIFVILSHVYIRSVLKKVIIL